MNANIKPRTPVSRNDGFGVVPALTFGKDGNMELTEVLRGGRQCDEDGVEIIMSRQACCEAADEIERLRGALAGISAEMGVPPTIGTAKGELKRLLDNGKGAIERLRIAPRGVSAEADFEAMTWTFEIAPDCMVGAGTYALVRLGSNAELSGRPLANGSA